MRSMDSYFIEETQGCDWNEKVYLTHLCLQFHEKFMLWKNGSSGLIK